MKMITTNQRIEQFNRLMNNIITLEFSDWLRRHNFFTCPASTKHHGAYEGGLFDHSLAVTEKLLEMNLNWSRPESPYIVGMFHDLCKIDQYNTIVDDEGTTKFGSDEVTGRNVRFSYNDNCILKGHGEKSVMLLSQFMILTIEEIYCIRYHMGAYETDNWKQYDLAIRQFENVLWTHTADMYASKVLDI